MSFRYHTVGLTHTIYLKYEISPFYESLLRHYYQNSKPLIC